MAKLCELKDIFPMFFNYQVFSCIKRFCEKNIIQLVTQWLRILIIFKNYRNFYLKTGESDMITYYFCYPLTKITVEF